MKRLPLILALLSTFSHSGHAQTMDAMDGRAMKAEVSLAGVSEGQISIRALLNKPVAKLVAVPGTITGFALSWVANTGKGYNFQGPYRISGNTITGVALKQLKSDSRHGRISRLYVEEVSVLGADGTPAFIKAAKAYNVVQ